MALQDRQQRAVPSALLAGIVLGRLVLMPLAAVAIVIPACWLGWLPPDPIMLLLLLLQGATPSAMSLGVISSMHGQYMDEIAEVLFVVNVCSVPLFTASTAAFLALLQPQGSTMAWLTAASAQPSSHG